MTLTGVYYASDAGIENLEALRTRLSVTVAVAEQLGEATNQGTISKLSESRLEIRGQ